jgi:hypothetical protein
MAYKEALQRFKGVVPAIKDNSQIFAWCMYVMVFLVNFGFDSKMTGLIIAFPEFRKDYGY